MAEKFILVSLDEQKSKELGDIISNKTSRRILDYLSDKEGSSSEISRELGIPISTVEYNLKNLVKASLVEVEEFKWSPKGRQQDIYKVKKKYIVITPRKGAELREVLKRVLPIGVFGIIIAGILEYFSSSRILKIPLTKEVITKTITESKQVVMDKAVGGGAQGTAALAESTVASKGMISEPIVNVTTQVTEVVKDVVLPNPHYGFWFLFGLIVALALYMLFSLRKK